MALHHGSLDRDVRERVEEGLRRDQPKGVVCTSSLDLGVDFAPVDQVLQIGSPKGVARLLQRAGRSGHQPGATAKVTCVPAHAMELIEAAAAREAAAAAPAGATDADSADRWTRSSSIWSRAHSVEASCRPNWWPTPRHACLRGADRRAMAVGAGFRRPRRRQP